MDRYDEVSSRRRLTTRQAAQGGVVWSDLAVLVLWATAGLAIGLWCFTWTPATTAA